MSASAREYVDFWIENSVHAVEQVGTGATQDVDELVRRLVAGAEGEGITEQAMRDEVGDLAQYIRDKLKAANRAESDRSK